MAAVGKGAEKTGERAEPGAREATPEEPLLHGGDACSPDQQRELLRFASTLRSVVSASVEVGGSRDALARLADRAEALLAAVQAEARGKALPLMAPHDSAPTLNGMLPYSPVMGRANPIAPPLWLERGEGPEGVRAVGRVTLAGQYQGAHGIAHGGVVSAIWDEVLAFATILAEIPGPTGELRVRYLRPTPLYEPLVFEAWVAGAEGRRVFAEGVCRVEGSDAVVTRAEGTFVRFAPGGADESWMDRGKDLV